MSTPNRMLLVLLLTQVVGDLAQGQGSREDLMSRARRMAADGQEFIINSTATGAEGQGGTIVFYNNPRPFCYTYVIPGDWVPSQTESGWRSKDGRQFAGVLFTRSRDLKGFKGGTLVEQAGAAIAAPYEKSLGLKLADIRLTPFESARQGTWRWTFTRVKQGDREIGAPTKIIADFTPDGVAVITIAGTPDDDGLARRVIGTLKTTKDPQCYFPVLDDMLKAMTGTSGPPAAPTPARVESTARPHVYTSPNYRWSVWYPGDWTIEDADPNSVRILSPARDGVCGLHSSMVRVSTVDEFAEAIEASEEQARKSKGVTAVKRSYKHLISLPNSINGIDILREIPSGGRSRRIYILADGVGYAIDCETYANNWGRLDAFFARIINSFTLPPKQAATAAQPSPTTSEAEAEVLKAEDAFRLAKVQNDTQMLGLILADDYIGLNQYGVRRNKSQVIDIYRDFKLSLTPAAAAARVSGDIAIVNGTQTERNPVREEKLHFLRTYIKRDGRWQLVSSTQFTAPVAVAPPVVPAGMAADVAHALGETWRENLTAQARRTAADGQEFIINTTLESAAGQTGTHVFYNNSRPFCYTYVIPGDWVPSQTERGGWRSIDRRQFAGVFFTGSEGLKGYAGETLVERASAAVAARYEKLLGQKLADIKLRPFESARQGTWKWSFAQVEQRDRLIGASTKIIVDFSPDGIAVITTEGTGDDDGLARRVIGTMEITKDPPCYLPVLDDMLTAMAKTSSPSTPVVIYKVDPDYSEEARKAVLVGHVSLQLVVDSEGRARNIDVTRSLGLGLEQKAVEAVNKWKFRPGYRNGQPVAVVATIDVNFNLLEPTGWLLTRALFEVPDGATRPVFTKFARPKTHDYKGAGTNPNVLFEVDTNGTPHNIRFAVPPQQDISNDLIEAIKKWRFTPAQKERKPVAANATFEFVFR